jgi:hypothetical protein
MDQSGRNDASLKWALRRERLKASCSCCTHHSVSNRPTAGTEALGKAQVGRATEDAVGAAIDKSISDRATFPCVGHGSEQSACGKAQSRASVLSVSGLVAPTASVVGQPHRGRRQNFQAR